MENSEGKKIPKMELAEALKQLRDVSSGEDYNSVKNILLDQMKQREVEAAIGGLTQEDEFALMCRLMGTAETLVRLDQKKIILGDYDIPDFIGSFKPGCWRYGFTSKDSAGFQCCIEVKSTNKSPFKFGGQALEGLRDFSDTIGFPLIFAVRFLEFGNNQYWLFVEDANRECNTIKVKVDDFDNNIRHILWDEYLLFLNPQIRLIYIYEKNGKKDGIGHEKYGEFVELKILKEEEVISYEGVEANVFAMFFESFELEERDARTEDGKTFILMEPGFYLTFLADLVYKTNMLITTEEGRPLYEPSRIIASSRLGPDPILANRSFMENVARQLIDAGLVFLVGIGDEEKLLEGWRKYGGTR